jgi:hypothetical protein
MSSARTCTKMFLSGSESVHSRGERERDWISVCVGVNVCLIMLNRWMICSYGDAKFCTTSLWHSCAVAPTLPCKWVKLVILVSTWNMGAKAAILCIPGRLFSANFGVLNAWFFSLYFYVRCVHRKHCEYLPNSIQNISSFCILSKDSNVRSTMFHNFSFCFAVRFWSLSV